MWQRILGIATALVALILATGGAEAKRGGVPIPCSSEKIIKVMDLPGFKTAGGIRMDLGYLVDGCFSGKWVGYVGSNSQYLSLQDGDIPAQAIKLNSGVAPKVPRFLSALFSSPGQFWVEWLYLVLAVGGVAFLLFKAFAQKMLIPLEPIEPAVVAPSAAAAPQAATAARRPARTFAPSAGQLPRNQGAAPAFGRRG
jgi:hypothetical protein